ncbi:ectoine/hydroxyectoine ABC transporter substrate-binding protein EhuB [Streptomyces sp. JJ38]|uniref:ectoine/hydroxyectoine ABC transporter substrate-binding protein EhuB n=1 Tax=Streptomyces sp. JJ38 TaxID=2738128 RepID=UPI001C5929DE|nr:ectoine/hydroxyectoine ABC transporter substrate-binding protein EhuB [Streptomyces sp. JJ38]MBW1598680.1 ectoine/hydroxyectoine ABC transporter substrate-binding protein EhuB [Streptomyces sp. JJ38]
MAPPPRKFQTLSEFRGIGRRPISRRALLGGTAALGLLGAAGCSKAPAEGKVEGGDLLERLRDRGTVRVGIASEPPFGYINSEGEAAGEAPDIAKVIFQRLGVPNIEPVPTEFSALIPGLQAQQFDCVSAGMYINPTRCAQVLFSDPDYLMLDAFIVPEGNPKNIRTYQDVKEQGLRLASGEAYAEVAYAKDAGISDILILPDQVAGLDAVVQGRVDAFAGTNITVQAVVKGNDRADGTEPFQPTLGGEPAYGAGGFAFRLSEKNLRDAFNRELHKLKEDDYKELLQIVEPYGFTRAEMTDLTAEELCA